MNNSVEYFKLLETRFTNLHDEYVRLVAANAHTESLEKLRAEIKQLSQQMKDLKSNSHS
jgi:hypothetical protein